MPLNLIEIQPLNTEDRYLWERYLDPGLPPPLFKATAKGSCGGVGDSPLEALTHLGYLKNAMRS